MRVEHFLVDSAAVTPDKTALVVDEQCLTYRDLDNASSALARHLIGNGVERGDRVAIFLDNSAAAAISIFAVLKAGAAFCPINPSTKAEKLAGIVEQCRPVTLITSGRHRPVVEQALSMVSAAPRVIASDCADMPDAWTRFEQAIVGDESPVPDVGEPQDLAMLIYTSGSTGRPKGVMMTHQNVVAAALSVIAYLGGNADDIVLSALPFSFSYGLYQLLMSVKVGGTLVLERSFAFPQATLGKIVAERVTGFPIVPTMAAQILQMKTLASLDLPSLRYITSASAPMPVPHIQRLTRLFPNAAFYSMYGQTECKRGTYLPPDQIASKPDSVGIAIPGTEAFVVNEAGQRLPPGMVGELALRGPHVMKGYWEDPEATARALRTDPVTGETVLRTGDLFRADEDGYLYFVARKDDIIKTRGEKVSPNEVENVLHALPGIKEAVVIGVPDPLIGLAIKAIIVADDDRLTTRDVVRHCARCLESFMVPKHVEFRAALPKSANGKIDRRAIVETVLEVAE